MRLMRPPKGIGIQIKYQTSIGNRANKNYHTKKCGINKFP